MVYGNRAKEIATTIERYDKKKTSLHCPFGYSLSCPENAKDKDEIPGWHRVARQLQPTPYRHYIHVRERVV